MYRLLYFTFYLLLTLNTKAQTLTSYSKIYYVDGSILIGEISSWSKDTVEIILANAAKIPIPRNLIKELSTRKPIQGSCNSAEKDIIVN